jgi:peptide/nickel transport system substrate-binding protein
METRFGVKDFFLFLLLIVLLIVIGLAMKQYDRQYQIVRDIDQQGRDQLRDLDAIRSALEHGVAATGSTSQPAAMEGEDPFPELRKLVSEGKYNQGDWFVMNLMGPVSKITPMISEDYNGQIIDCRVTETLAYHDNDTQEYRPMLATSWQISPDGLTFTFQLRHGVVFSDGSPFTADDVVFSFDLTMNPATDCPAYRQQFDTVASCTKINDYEVVFKMKEPFYQTFENLGAGLEILSKAFYSKYTIDQINNSVGLLIGTGPYRMATPDGWKPDPGKIELLRNDHYWGVPPSFDRIVFLQTESDSTELIMFTNGEEDVISLHPQQYKLLLQSPDVVARTNHWDYETPLAPYAYIAWNQKRNGKPTIFADKRVRQAMTMLTDRQGVCDSIYLGYAVPAKGPYSRLSKQSDPALQDWPYDPDRAKALLKQAGFEDRGHGVLELADGTQLSFKLTYPSKNETTDRMMQYIKDGYARAGVGCELDPLDWSILLQRLKTRDYDTISLSWAAGGLEDDIYQMFDSSQIVGDGDNVMSYSNPELDAAIRKARTTVDETARMQFWHQCESILHEDQPYTFLIRPKALRFMDKRIENVHRTLTGLNIVWNWWQPLPWYVPPGLQKYK